MKKGEALLPSLPRTDPRYEKRHYCRCQRGKGGARRRRRSFRRRRFEAGLKSKHRRRCCWRSQGKRGEREGSKHGERKGEQEKRKV